MILRFVKKWTAFNDYTGKYEDLNATINKTYQCLPIDGDYRKLLFYNDNKEWQQADLMAFAPVDPKPLVEWEE